MNQSPKQSTRFLKVCLVSAAIVWTAWLIFVGPGDALAVIQGNWPVTLTMVFGSFVAGATSEGGGAVAFPVFTKLLDVAPADAKLFSLAIQSVGMSSASIAIVAVKIPVQWAAIGWASLGGVVGIYLSLLYLAPQLPAPETKVFFSALQAGFAGTLMFTMLRRRADIVDSSLNLLQTRAALLIAGLVGGMASGLVGSGIDLIVFSTMVLLFGVSEKVATPTSVILMAVNSLAGVAIYQFHHSTFPGNVYAMWLAAVPVVVIGAPAGAYVCSLLSRRTIAWILIGLISIEVLTSLLILPRTLSVACVGLVSAVCFLSVFGWMAKQRQLK